MPLDVLADLLHERTEVVGRRLVGAGDQQLHRRVLLLGAIGQVIPTVDESPQRRIQRSLLDVGVASEALSDVTGDRIIWRAGVPLEPLLHLTMLTLEQLKSVHQVPRSLGGRSPAVFPCPRRQKRGSFPVDFSLRRLRATRSRGRRPISDVPTSGDGTSPGPEEFDAVWFAPEGFVGPEDAPPE